MTKCFCNNNSEYAYILKNKNDEPINKITISNYILNKELRNEIKSGDKYLVCKEKHDLIKYESLIKKCHFKHKSISLITDWHKDWQNNFEQKEIPIGNHIADVIVDNINKSKNKIIYSLPYNPQCNPIENLFSQLKSHVKNKSPDNFQELKSTIDNIIKHKITEEHLKNYFNYLFTQANDYINKKL